MNIRTKLKVNDVVDIYTDYQDENENTYEGRAILLKKVRNGDSFYRKDEQIKVDEKKEYTKYERRQLKKYNRIKSFFCGINASAEKEIIKLKKELIALRKDDNDDIENMNRTIDTYKVKYKDSVKRIKTLLDEFDNDYIIRYIQQDREKWHPSIYTYERWLVQFTKDKTDWSVNFRTERNIRILVKLNPNEHVKSADIRKFTTYNNGVSSLSMYVREDSDDDDDEITSEISEMFDEYEVDNTNDELL